MVFKVKVNRAGDLPMDYTVYLLCGLIPWLGFVEAMKAIKAEAESNPDLVKGAPYSLPVRRLDDVKAARELDLAYKPAA